MNQPEQNLSRLIEQIVTDDRDLSRRGLWFGVDTVEVKGHPPERVLVWATLHFLPAGSPFCCGEPGCHLGNLSELVSDRVRLALGLTQPVAVEFGDRIGVNYHEGVKFKVHSGR